MGALVLAEILKIVAELIRKRPPADVLAELRNLEAAWPEPIGADDLDAAIKAGLDRTTP